MCIYLPTGLSAIFTLLAGMSLPSGTSPVSGLYSIPHLVSFCLRSVALLTGFLTVLRIWKRQRVGHNLRSAFLPITSGLPSTIRLNKYLPGVSALLFVFALAMNFHLAYLELGRNFNRIELADPKHPVDVLQRYDDYTLQIHYWNHVTKLWVDRDWNGCPNFALSKEIQPGVKLLEFTYIEDHRLRCNDIADSSRGIGYTIWRDHGKPILTTFTGSSTASAETRAAETP